MSEKKNTSFTQASLLAREEKVLQDAEIVITTQRNRIGELRSELERLNAEKVYWSNTHMKEMSDVIQENTKLRLQLDEMNSDLNALRHTQDNTDNLITNLTEALGAAESQLLSQDNELKRLRNLAGNLPRENNELREQNQRLLAENEKLKRLHEENSRYLETNKLSKNGMLESENNSIQAVNDSLKKHAKLARDLNFKTEELRVNKMCLLQLESDLLEHQLLVEQQRVEIQRLNTAVEALNREKALIPPVVITSYNLESQNNNNEFNNNSNSFGNGVTLKDISEQIIAEIAKILPKFGKENELGANVIDNNELDIAQYRTMEEQRILISRLLKGLDQLGFTRSEATCYKERASDYRWFYSAVISHSVTYNTKDPGLNEDGDAITNSTISPPGFFNLFVRVESGNLSIFQNIDEEVPMFSIKPWKSNVEIFEKHRQFVITRVSTTSDQIENHIFYCQTEDEFNRWFYALCYGGFIKSWEYVNNETNNNFVNSSNDDNNLNNCISIKIYDSNNASNYQLTHLSINNDKLMFNNGIGRIDACKSKLKIDLKKEQVIIDYTLSNGSNKTVTFSSDDSKEFDKLKNTLLKCNWLESTTMVDNNINAKNKKDVADYTINVGGSKNNITSKLKLGKELIPQSINFSVNNNENENSSVIERHGIIMVENNQVLLYHNESDINPFARIDIDDASVEFDRRKMSILMIKTKNSHVESFYYMFASLEEFNRSLARLREGGIKDYNNTEKRLTTKQVCVVCKNKIYFYKDFEDSINSVSFLTISPDDTNCHIDPDRNEIVLIYSQNESTRKKIILDCANMDEFIRWNIALSFGGFTEGVKRSSMSKYTFDISLFEVRKHNGKEELINIETNENKSIYKDFYNITDYQSIEIFKTEENKRLNKPLMIIPFKDTEYIGDAKKRQIIFLTRRGKAGEVRVIFNLQTLSNFDLINKDLINVDFPLLESHNAATSSKAEYIIGAKNGILCVYCTSRNKENHKDSNKDNNKLGVGIKHVLNENKYLNKGAGVSSYNNNNGNSHNHHNDSDTRRFPECGYIKYLVSDFICVASRAGRSVALRRKEDDYDALSVRCKSLTEYEKWERSMSIAGFINSESVNNNTSVNTINNSYLPPITYLFHSLDYDFRKQPILPTLSKDKTITNSPGVTNSDLNLSDYSSLDGFEDNITSHNNKNRQLFNQKHLLIPKNKKLDSTSIHKQTPPPPQQLSSCDNIEDDDDNCDCHSDEIRHADSDVDYFNNYIDDLNNENVYHNSQIIIDDGMDFGMNNYVEFNALEENNCDYGEKEYDTEEHEIDCEDDESDLNNDTDEIEFSGDSNDDSASNRDYSEEEESKYQRDECNSCSENAKYSAGNLDLDENCNNCNIVCDDTRKESNKVSRIKERISQRKDKLRRMIGRIRHRKQMAWPN
ncbi:hypothetical protein FG386_002835 [Cryptosporidium ryanae]|uniref:uncharacterized protein n=1 Tax=Cryptosporidium ryanae TaxID=515981 RepID=UPI00351AAA29|nr:hypothetical protein FG386_002835 [Cryptosporidium ryanae]